MEGVARRSDRVSAAPLRHTREEPAEDREPSAGLVTTGREGDEFRIVFDDRAATTAARGTSLPAAPLPQRGRRMNFPSCP